MPDQNTPYAAPDMPASALTPEMAALVKDACFGLEVNGEPTFTVETGNGYACITDHENDFAVSIDAADIAWVVESLLKCKAVLEARDA